MSGTLRRLLLAGTCLCIYGTPVPLHLSSTEDSRCGGQCVGSVSLDASAQASGVNFRMLDSDRSARDVQEHAGLPVNVGGEGGEVGPDGQSTEHKGAVAVIQDGNRDGLDEGSVPRKSGGEARSQRNQTETVRAGPESSFETAGKQKRADTASELSTDPESKPDAVEELKAAPVDAEAMLTSTREKEEMTVVTNTPKPALSRLSESATVPPQALSLGAMAQSKRLSLGNGPSDEGYRRGLTRFGTSLQEEESEASRPSSMDPPAWMESLTSNSGSLLGSLSSSPSLSPLTPMPLSAWSQEGMTISTPPGPLLPDIGPNLMPRQDGPETLWTEAVRQSGEDTAAPLSQDEATEGTMSSEALPLIFEPFEDVVTPAAGVTLVPPPPVSSQPPPAAMATGGGGGGGGMLLLAEDTEDLDQPPPSPVTVETDDDGGDAARDVSPPAPPPLLLPDWMSPWQTSGSSPDPPIGGPPSGPSAATPPPPPAETDATRPPGKGADWTKGLKVTFSSSSSLSSTRFTATTAAMAPRRPASNSMSGLEEMESEEEPDEDEEDENTEESDEEDSDEDQTGTPQTASTARPPYSIIPPPPVWVQRNQGLMRSWVELIREKAGYVSGMLAPVGIGITGALLIVGALYSIRMIHRKRRNSYKHQRRRKVRQPQQPREPGTARQDQAMLLADSSEDEF